MRAGFTIAAVSILLCSTSVADRRSDDLTLHRGLIAAIKQRDIAGVKRRVKLPLRLLNMQFETAACARFTGDVELAEPELAAFVGCLADLGMKHLDGADDVWVNAVYGPGIALTFAHLRGDPVTTFYSWRESGKPTFEPATFSSHIASFTRVIEPEDALKRMIDASTTDRVIVDVPLCVDDRGKLQTVDVKTEGRGTLRADRPKASDAELLVYEQRIRKAVRAWSIRPFEVRGRSVAACTRLRLGYPGDRLGPLQLSSDLMPRGLPSPDPDADHRTLRMHASYLAQNRIAGHDAIVPDAATKTGIHNAGVARIIAGVAWCIDEAGTVVTVRLLMPSGFPAYDAKVTSEVSTWRYRPFLIDEDPVPACTTKTFVYTQTST